MMFPDRIALANYGGEKLVLIAYADIILGIVVIIYLNLEDVKSEYHI